MIAAFNNWNASVESSIKGNAFANGLESPDPERVFWNTLPQYQPYFKEWKKRPEYENALKSK